MALRRNAAAEYVFLDVTFPTGGLAVLAYRVIATVTQLHFPSFSFVGLCQGRSFCSSCITILNGTVRQNP